MSWDNLPSHLRGFADELARQPETSITADALRAYHGKFVGSWRANKQIAAKDIPVPVPRDQGLHPVGCKPVQAFLSFEFELGGGDPGFPDVAAFQVRVESLLEISSGTVELQDHWRVDTDVFVNPRKTAEKGAAPSREPHPYYHYQRGGHAQDAFASEPNFVPGASLPSATEWKALGQSPSPRIPVIPMCPILAIDHSIAEHNGLVWRRLRAAPEYASFIRIAQERLWAPFFEAIQNAKQRRFWLGPTLLS